MYANKDRQFTLPAIGHLWNSIFSELKPSSAVMAASTTFRKIGGNVFNRGDAVLARDWPGEFESELRFVCVIAEEEKRRYTIVWNPNTKEYRGLGFMDRLDNFPFTKLGEKGQSQGETNDALGAWLQEKCLISFSGIKGALERLRSQYNVKLLAGSGPRYERRQQVKQFYTGHVAVRVAAVATAAGAPAASAPPPSAAADPSARFATLQQLLQSHAADKQMQMQIDQQAGVVIHPPLLTPLIPSHPPHPTSHPSHPISPHLTPPQWRWSKRMRPWR
jgi:hypothetical protein